MDCLNISSDVKGTSVTLTSGQTSGAKGTGIGGHGAKKAYLKDTIQQRDAVFCALAPSCRPLFKFTNKKCEERSTSGFTTQKGPPANSPPEGGTKTDALVAAGVVSWQSLLDIPVSAEGAYVPTDQYKKYLESLEKPRPKHCPVTLPSSHISDFPHCSSVASHQVEPLEPQERPSKISKYVPISKPPSRLEIPNFHNLPNIHEPHPSSQTHIVQTNNMCSNNISIRDTSNSEFLCL